MADISESSNKEVALIAVAYEIAKQGKPKGSSNQLTDSQINNLANDFVQVYRIVSQILLPSEGSEKEGRS